jgi:hypothetical protein
MRVKSIRSFAFNYQAFIEIDTGLFFNVGILIILDTTKSIPRPLNGGSPFLWLLQYGQ